MIGAQLAGLYGTGVAPSTTAYESISTVTVGTGGVATVTFSSIPSTYKNLQIRGIARSTANNGDGDYMTVKFNSDSGANYSYHVLVGTGAAAQSSAATSQNSAYFQRIASAGQAASVFGAVIVDILDYQNTNKNKTVRELGGYDSNGGGQINLVSNAWYNSGTAISTITLAAGGGNLAEFSQFALYGIKG